MRTICVRYLRHTGIVEETSPTARALLCLEMIQNSPGITALALSERLGLTDRAIRRYVAILREAEIPIESERGRYGGYRVGRGLRRPGAGPVRAGPAAASDCLPRRRVRRRQVRAEAGIW